MLCSLEQTNYIGTLDVDQFGNWTESIEMFHIRTRASILEGLHGWLSTQLFDSLQYVSHQ